MNKYSELGIGYLIEMASDKKKILYSHIAECTKIILEDNGIQGAEYRIADSLVDLPLTPTKKVFKRYWNYIVEVYHDINGVGLHLDEVLENNQSELQIGNQEADIYFYSPIRMIIEFDEKQHFNQFRKKTLESEVYLSYKGFDLEVYKSLNDKVVKPGKMNSGFCFLTNPDPLFPANENEELQDNRHRQRAFRDFLKDLFALETDMMQTVRVPAALVKWKRDSLTTGELELVTNYLQPIINSIQNND